LHGCHFAFRFSISERLRYLANFRNLTLNRSSLVLLFDGSFEPPLGANFDLISYQSSVGVFDAIGLSHESVPTYDVPTSCFIGYILPPNPSTNCPTYSTQSFALLISPESTTCCAKGYSGDNCDVCVDESICSKDKATSSRGTGSSSNIIKIAIGAAVGAAVLVVVVIVAVYFVQKSRHNTKWQNNYRALIFLSILLVLAVVASLLLSLLLLLSSS